MGRSSSSTRKSTRHMPANTWASASSAAFSTTRASADYGSGRCAHSLRLTFARTPSTRIWWTHGSAEARTPLPGGEFLAQGTDIDSSAFSIRRLTRNAEAPLLFEGFLVAAVCSFLGIRWFLALTGYPKIGSNGIHIAHMLWGGLLMLLALILLLSFLNRSVEHAAAIIAGLGFGTFIDEIGKFVTSDNNYFYRPAISLI